MNEFTPISLDNAWIIGAIAVSFFAGCVYRLCVLLGREAQAGGSNDTDCEDRNSRYDREMLHVRQLQDELLQVRRAVEQRTSVGAPGAGMSTPAAPPARPPEFIDPTEFARPVELAEPAEFAKSADPAKAAEPAKPAELGIDPFKLAVSGASIKVLMNRCRLSQAEAELVFSIHGAGSGRKANPVRRAARASRQALTA